MPCLTCKRDVPVRARNMCAPCYQRWNKTGTTDYQRWGRRSVCGVGGCGSQVVSHGLCDVHRQRMNKHGHTNDTRPDSWGAVANHPLRYSWTHLRRNAASHGVSPVWLNDFLQFAVDVGDRPSPKHKLFVADDSKPIGPGNFVWKRAITERVPGEDYKTYINRAQKVYRAVRTEAFQGYGLKKNYGLSAVEYAAMVDAQGGLCAVCSQPETARQRKSSDTRALAVDHCHTSGKVRALLCTACNTGLGSFNDDPARLTAAIAYLRQHKEALLTSGQHTTPHHTNKRYANDPAY